MQDPRIGLLVPARLQSSRLPEKMLIDVEGKPALWYVLDRMKIPKTPHVRILCTSVNPADDRIAAYGESQGWIVFRGDEEDVLQRYLDACLVHGIDFMVNVDGDDLFCSEEYVDRLVERYRSSGADYLSCKGLPFGGAPTGLKISALRVVCERKEDRRTQGWGKYFAESGLFHIETVEADEKVRRPDYRMTLDYPEDLDFFRAVVRALDPGHARRLTLAEIVAFLDAHPAVAVISQRVSAEYWERFRREHGAFRMRGASNPG